MNTELFLWSALDSCLVMKPDTQTYTSMYMYCICTDYIAMFRFLRERRVWCKVHVICTCLHVHTSCDEKCNYFKHNGNFVMNCDIQYCAIHNKYFIRTVACLFSVGAGRAAAIVTSRELSVSVMIRTPLFWESVSQQVFSPRLIVLRQMNLTVLCSFKRIPRWPPLTLILLSATDVIIPRTDIS